MLPVTTRCDDYECCSYYSCNQVHLVPLITQPTHGEFSDAVQYIYVWNEGVKSCRHYPVCTVTEEFCGESPVSSLLFDYAVHIFL